MWKKDFLSHKGNCPKLLVCLPRAYNVRFPNSVGRWSTERFIHHNFLKNHHKYGQPPSFNGPIGIVLIIRTSTKCSIEHTLSINQAHFSTRGFASTVWDSAIVLSKYLERWPSKVYEKACIELGAGCGLPGITAACLGASSVLLTDLSENLPLLKENVLKNSVSATVSVAKLEWGCQGDSLDSRTFDVVLAADVMYDASVIPAFLQTLQNVATSSTSIFVAYGRNRQAEEEFFKEVSRQGFSIEKIEVKELDEVYQCIDVDVFVMQIKQPKC